MQLSWQKCLGNVWGSLLWVDLGHIHFNSMEGVYVIWQMNGPVIRVGQGVIKDRLATHRNDSAVTRYQNLLVTWAPVPAIYRNGVERYLANTLRPIIGDAFPNAYPIAVNLP
jgi:hypothetical protein